MHRSCSRLDRLKRLLFHSAVYPPTLLYFPEEERGQKRKRELDEEGEEDEDD